MQNYALKVVDAVRAMKLVHRNGKTISELDLKPLAMALDGVRKAIEEFDTNTGYTAGDFQMKHRPEFAVPLQMADDGYIDDIREHSPSLEMKLEMQAELEDEVEVALEEKELEDVKKSMVQAPDDVIDISEPIIAAAVLSHMTAKPGMNKARRKKLSQVGNGVFYDGDQYVNELRLAVNSINDKLTHAVRKIGWNPRLRRLADALRNAQDNFSLEMKGGQSFVRIPSDRWAVLSKAIAESALNQDLTVHLPKRTPKNSLDQKYNLKNTPRPPSSMFDD